MRSEFEQGEAAYPVLLEKHKPLVVGWVNSPGHSHSCPGIWDSDNGLKAGTICEQCRRWNTYGDLLKENVDLRVKLDRAVEALETLKVAVNDKVNDPGATAFIERTIAEIKGASENE